MVRVHNLFRCPTVSAKTDSFPSAYWLKCLVSTASPNHTLTLSCPGSLASAPLPCGYCTTTHAPGRSRFSAWRRLCMCVRSCLRVHLEKNVLQLSAVFSAVLLGEEDGVCWDAVVRHPAVALQHPYHYVWKTVLGLRHRKRDIEGLIWVFQIDFNASIAALCGG